MTKSRQVRVLTRILGSCRYVYNDALAFQKEHYEQFGKKLNYAALCKRLTQLKKDEKTIWLNQSPSQSLQQSLKDGTVAKNQVFANLSFK